MTHEIHSTWGEFRYAFRQILRVTRKNICIFDDDLTLLGMQQAESVELVQQLLARDPTSTMRIVLRRIDRLRNDHPRLVQLLASQSHRVRITQIPENLQHLRDTFVVSDDEHALVRFDLEQPRHKFILADKVETTPYVQRFADIWITPGIPFVPVALGL